jgi:catechol 2,3-dioxygenase-like lactoylglutathione lyase family enzyme
MPGSLRFGFVVEYVQDITAARRFYVEVLGLAVEREHPTYVQFDRFAIASDAPMAGGGELELYWLVDDAERALHALPPGTNVSLPLTQRPFGRVFGIRDPDGHPRYLLELAANRRSRPA